MKTAINSFAKRYLSDTSGNIAMLFGLAMVAVMAVVGVSVDYAQSLSAKDRMVSAVDATVLAVARDPGMNPGQSKQLAKNMMEAEYMGSRFEAPEIVDVIRNGDTVTITARTEVDTSFMTLFGRDTVMVQTQAQATYAQQKLDITLVLDNTGSMSGAKLAALKNASNDLVDMLLVDGRNNAGTQVGLVPFAAWVNVGRDKARANWMDRFGRSPQVAATGNRFQALADAGQRFNGCVEARLAPYDTTDVPANATRPATLFQPMFPATNDCPSDRQAVTALTNNKDQLKRSIRNMRASGNTNIANGMTWGFHMMSPEAPFTEAREYDGETRKVMVVLTDGVQTMRRGVGSPFGPLNARDANGNSRLRGANARDALDTKLLDVCTNAKSKGVEVYAITFLVRDAATEATLRACASADTHYYDVQSAQALGPVFREIAGAVSDLRLTH